MKNTKAIDFERNKVNYPRPHSTATEDITALVLHSF